jgi:hypothetical protein
MQALKIIIVQVMVFIFLLFLIPALADGSWIKGMACGSLATLAFGVVVWALEEFFYEV